MIDFKGYLTGKTEKHYHKRNKLFSWILMTAALLALLPGTISISITIKMYILLIINVFGLAIVPLITLIPDSKKTRVVNVFISFFADDPVQRATSRGYTLK